MAEMEGVCREFNIPDNVDQTISEINRKLLKEITAFRGQMEIYFPRALPERCWKIQSKMKLLIFSKSDDDIDAFLKWSFPESCEEETRHRSSEVEQALKQAKMEELFILPIVLVSRTFLKEKSTVCMKSILQNYMSESIVVLTFSPSSKNEMQSVIDSLETNQSQQMPVVFSKEDAMFRGFLTRKMKDMMHKQCEKVLKSAQKLLQDLKKVPTCENVDFWLNRILHDRISFYNAPLKERTFFEGTPFTKDNQSNQRHIRDRAVDELCKNTINVCFKELAEGNGCLRMFLVDHFQCFMAGMMVCIVQAENLPPKNKCLSPGWRKRDVTNVLKQVQRKWPKCMKEYFNEEITTISNLVDIMQEQFIPKLLDITKTCKVHDEVSYNVQVRLSRIPGVRSFGIEDKKFKVYVDSTLLEDESLLTRLKKSVDPHHDVDRSSLQAWQEPIFHRRIGDLIEGKDNRRGMITTFAEMVDSNWKNPKASHSLYFITCEHVAPEKEMRVFFLKCSKCESKRIDCTCDREELGINMYPFSKQMENPFNAMVDITCGKVSNQTFEHCDTSVSVPHSRRIEVADFSSTIESHTGKSVFKWDCDGNQQKGKYYGVQFMIMDSSPNNINPFAIAPRRVDIIQSEEGHSFGREGHSGALIFLMQSDDEKDIISPAFVYLGRWSDAGNKYMSFRLQEGIQCLEMKYKLKLRLCLDNPRETSSLVALS